MIIYTDELDEFGNPIPVELVDDTGKHKPVNFKVFKNSVFEVLLNWLDGQILIFAPFIVNDWPRGIQRTFRYSSESQRAEDEFTEDASISKTIREKKKEAKESYALRFAQLHQQLKDKIYAQRGRFKDKKKNFSFPELKAIAYDLNSVDLLAKNLRAAVNLINYQAVRGEDGTITKIPYSEIFVIVPDGSFEVYGPDVLTSDGWQAGPFVGGIKPLIQELAAMKRDGLITPDITIRKVLASHALASWISYKSGLFKQIAEQSNLEVVYATQKLGRAEQAWQWTPCRHCSTVVLDDLMNFSIEMEKSYVGRAGECLVCKAEKNRAYIEWKNKYALPHYAKFKKTGRKVKVKGKVVEEKVSLEEADKTWVACISCGGKMEVSKQSEVGKISEGLDDENKGPLCETCVATLDWQEGHYKWKEVPPRAADIPHTKPDMRIAPGCDDNRPLVLSGQETNIKIKTKPPFEREIWSMEGEEVKELVVTPKERFQPLPPAISKDRLALLAMKRDLEEFMVSIGQMERSEAKQERMSPEFLEFLSRRDAAKVDKAVKEIAGEEGKVREIKTKDWEDRLEAPRLYVDENGYEYFYTKEPIRQVVPDYHGGAIIRHLHAGLRKKYTGRRFFHPYVGNVRRGGKKSSRAPQASVAQAHSTNEARIERVKVFAVDKEEVVVRGGIEESLKMWEQRLAEEREESIVIETKPQLDTLPKKSEQVDRVEITICSSCYEDFQAGDEVVETGAGSAMHAQCLKEVRAKLAVELKEERGASSEQE